MTAVAKLKTRVTGFDWEALEGVYGDEPIVIPTDLGLGLWLETEMIEPPSLKGRRVVLVVPPGQLTGLLRAVKAEMIRQRSKSMVS